MARHRLGGGDVDVVDVVAQDASDGLQLGDVAQRRGGAVYVDVVDVFGADAAVLDGVAHRLHGTDTLGVGSREVVGVGRFAAADEFAVDLGTAGLGVLQFLKYEGSGAFADHESVAVLVEGARGVPGIVVARGERLHGVETADRGFVDGSFRAAGDDDVGLAVADGVERGDEAVVGRGACRNGAVVGTHEAVLHGDEAGGDVGDHAGNEEGAKPRGHSTLGVAQTLVEERLETSDTRSPDDTDLLLVELVEVERRILDGLCGCDECILRKEVVFTHFLTVEILVRVVILHLTGEPGLEFFGIEMSNGRGAADAFFKIREVLLDVIAERVDRADTRNDYSSFCHRNENLSCVVK